MKTRNYLAWLISLWSSLLTVSIAQAADHAVILQYHHFGDDTPPSTSVTLAQFDRHLEHLAENDYRVWPLTRVVQQLRAGAELPEKVVAISVDDAYLSVYREAFPRLRARGWPFTVFVSPGPVDSRLPGQMSWEQMREMSRHGVSFANHSLDHAHLIRQGPNEDTATWRARVRRDILQTQHRLEQELGQAPRLFAYPYGEYHAALKTLLGELGFVAFGQQSGPASHNSDFLALPRFAMAVPYAAIEDFRVKLQTLPLPVVEAQPDDPLLPVTESRPRLHVRLQAGDYLADSLTCYVSGQGRTQAHWLAGDQPAFEVQAARPLPIGRSRYNCTARARQGNRYYWYSHLWIRRHPDGSWQRE
jgi:peptidoglycan/xylan/chitin deacetylase (PgdA/CDA1 family)